MKRKGFLGNVKKGLGMLPLTAEILQTLKPLTSEFPNGFRLDRLESALPQWIPDAESAFKVADPLKPRKVLLVASLRWWMEYCIALGLLLRGLGHEVDIAYVPYKTWNDPAEPFDVRRHRLYLRRTLAQLGKSLRFPMSAHPTPSNLYALLLSKVKILSVFLSCWRTIIECPPVSVKY